VAFDEGGLKIGFPEASTFNKRKAEAPERRELVADAFEAVTGERLRPGYVLLNGEAEPEPEADGPDRENLVEKLKSEFDAEEVG